jgi:hypothetical protein
MGCGAPWSIRLITAGAFATAMFAISVTTGAPALKKPSQAEQEG